MKIISLQYGHNASISYSENGIIKNILCEERFSRKKNHWGFPEKALDFIKKEYLSNDLKNLDKLVIIDKSGISAKVLYSYNFSPPNTIFPPPDEFNKIIGKRQKYYKIFPFFFKLIKKILFKFREKKNHVNFKLKLQKKYQLPLDKISEYDHHLSHAASFCYFEDYDPSEKYLIFTMDGEGDYKSSTVNILEKNGFNEISKNSSDVSIGYFFSHVTYYLGLKAGEHEFKVMGMAPYANKLRSDLIKKELEKLIWLNSDGHFSSTTQSANFIYELIDIFKLKRFDEIARASQEFLEDITIKWITYWIKKTNIKKIVVGGGVFMNVKLNKIIHEMSLVDFLFPIPSCTDDSLPIGGIFLENIKQNIEISKINNLYYGRSFDLELIKNFISDKKLEEDFVIKSFNSYEETNEFVSRLLADNNVIGRFSGQEEFGARALGNRSIICDPSKYSNLNRINKLIKKRDFWMPFTPSILEERQNDYFLNPKKVNSYYMSCTFESTQLARKELRAAVHPADFTIRPQVIKKDINFNYYNLVKKFEEKTSIGGILNTSFNLSGFPNVSTPNDAVETILHSGLNFLVLENFVLIKKN